MYSARNDTSASAGLSTAGSSSDDPSTDIDQLSEDLSLQQAVLASLLDLPHTSTTSEEVAAVRDEIANIKRRLQEAKRKGSIPLGSSTAVWHLLSWRLLQSTQQVRAWPTQIGPINLEVRTTICTISSTSIKLDTDSNQTVAGHMAHQPPIQWSPSQKRGVG
jgi:hypothetical protein